MSRMCVKFISLVVWYCWLQVPAGAAPDSYYRGTAENTKEEKADIAYPDDLGVRYGSNQNMMLGHHHHHHHPDFHHNHLTYPGEYPRGEGPTVDGPRQFNNLTIDNQISLDYIQDLNEYNVTDLLLHFIDGKEDSDDRFIQNTSGDDGIQEMRVASRFNVAKCVPELTRVKIATSDDPSIFYLPKCIRIERCGDCCELASLSCQPLEKENINVTVYRMRYISGGKYRSLGTESIMVEKHNKCKCFCRLKPEDCTDLQKYLKSICGCVCVNYEEKKKCAESSDIKLWNPELCACRCRKILECTTGSYFDPNECRCVTKSRNRANVNFLFGVLVL